MLSPSIEGNNLVFTCTVSGMPTPDVTWLKDGVVLSDDDDRVAILTDLSMRESQLQITSVIPEDSGLYTCSASNLAGVAVNRTRVDIGECLMFFS